jgi:hypothetical protein
MDGASVVYRVSCVVLQKLYNKAVPKLEAVIDNGDREKENQGDFFTCAIH